MSQNVQIVSGLNDRTIAQVDPSSGALVVVDGDIASVHAGTFFTSNFGGLAVASAASLELLVRVAASTEMHLHIGAASEATARVLLFENTTSSADGSAVARLNRNRTSAATSSTLVFSGPTITGDGDPLLNTLMPGGSGGNASGTAGTSAFEWILDAGDHLIRFTNEDAAAKDMTIQLNWDEHT